MRNCEEAINGAPTNAKESLRMVRQLRQIDPRSAWERESGRQASGRRDLTPGRCRAQIQVYPVTSEVRKRRSRKLRFQPLV